MVKMYKLEGLSIRKQQLIQWIDANNFTQPIIAKRLNMTLQELIDKLNNQEPFTQEQIRDLVYFMGANEAFKVMYFPTLEYKERIWQEVFIIRDEFNPKRKIPKRR